jgi:uncharacterized protein
MVMMRWFHAMMPKEERYFGFFVRHSRTILAGAEALQAMLREDAVSTYLPTIIDREHDADAITREVMITLRRTFITPFDRGDIKDLITSMDDAIDQIQQTGKVIGIFGIHSFEPEMRSMADRIVQCAGLIVEAVPLLSALHTKAGRLRELCDRIRQVEGQADDIHDAGLQRLYEVSSSTSNPTVFLTGQEVYKHLESAVDCFDDIANVIDGLVVEHT